MTESSIFTKRIFFIIALLVCCFVITPLFLNTINNRTKIVFCDVGQGDATYIRVENKVDIVIDAGPSKKIVDCLSRHMPFYDRSIELAFISHPEKDHFYGFIYLADRFKIERIYGSKINSDSISYKELIVKLLSHNIRVEQIKANDSFQILGDTIRIFWPTKSFLEQNKNIIGKNLNEYSLIMTFQEGKFKALFTGDASPHLLNGLLRQTRLKSDLLKIPHNGSKKGLSPSFLQLADPTTAVISVGKKNTYGHPTKFILDMLKAQNVTVRRTDKEGDIVFELGE